MIYARTTSSHARKSGLAVLAVLAALQTAMASDLPDNPRDPTATAPSLQNLYGTPSESALGPPPADADSCDSSLIGKYRAHNPDTGSGLEGTVQVCYDGFTGGPVWTNVCRDQWTIGDSYGFCEGKHYTGGFTGHGHPKIGWQTDSAYRKSMSLFNLTSATMLMDNVDCPEEGPDMGGYTLEQCPKAIPTLPRFIPTQSCSGGGAGVDCTRPTDFRLKDLRVSEYWSGERYQIEEFTTQKPRGHYNTSSISEVSFPSSVRYLRVSAEPIYSRHMTVIFQEKAPGRGGACNGMEGWAGEDWRNGRRVRQLRLEDDMDGICIIVVEKEVTHEGRIYFPGELYIYRLMFVRE